MAATKQVMVCNLAVDQLCVHVEIGEDRMAQGFQCRAARRKVGTRMFVHRFPSVPLDQALDSKPHLGVGNGSKWLAAESIAAESIAATTFRAFRTCL